MKFKLTKNPCFAFVGLICSVLLPSAVYEMFAKKPFLFASILAIFFVFFITNYDLANKTPHYCKVPLLLVSKTGHCVDKCPDNMISDSIACIDCFQNCATCSGGLKNQCITCKSGYFREQSGHCVENKIQVAGNQQIQNKLDSKKMQQLKENIQTHQIKQNNGKIQQNSPKQPSQFLEKLKNREKQIL